MKQYSDFHIDQTRSSQSSLKRRATDLFPTNPSADGHPPPEYAQVGVGEGRDNPPLLRGGRGDQAQRHSPLYNIQASPVSFLLFCLFLVTAITNNSHPSYAEETLTRQYGWRLAGEYDTTIQTGPATPHTPWTKPLPGGPLRVLAIVLAEASFDATELQQRLECAMNAMPASHWLHLGQNYWLNLWVEGSSSAERDARLLSWLDEPWDVIVLGNFHFPSLRPETRLKILDQVFKGTGLVMVYPHEMDPRLKAHPIPGAGSQIARGLPFAGLDYYNNIYMPRFDLLETSEIPDSLLHGYQFGQGKILLVDFGTVSSVFDAVRGGFTPAEEFKITSPVQYDYHQALIVKSLLWAANRQSRLTWPKDLPDGLEVHHDEMPKDIEIPFHWTGDKGKIEWTYRIRNIWNDIELESHLEQYINPGEDWIHLNIPPLEGGLHYVDFIANVNGIPENWGSFAVKVRPALAIDRLSTDRHLHEPGETVNGKVHLNRLVPEDGGWSLALRLEDCYNRTFSQSMIRIPAATDQIAFSLPPGQVISWGARLRVRVLRDEEPQHEAETEIAFRRPLRGRFPAAMWGALDGYAARAGNLLMRDFGFNAVIGNPLHLWRDDLGLMVFGAANGALIHSLGDELSVPDMKKGEAFTKFIQSRYNSIEAVNRAWGTTWKSWDEVAPYADGHSDGAGACVHYHDTESAAEQAYADGCRKQRLAIEKGNPTGVVGPEGSELGDPDLTLPAVTFWGPYFSERDNLLVTAAGDPKLLRGNWFGGYVADRIKETRLNYILWRSILGGNNLIEYFCISGNEGFISTSLTVNPFVDRFRPSWEQIRHGLGQLLDVADPVFGPVAVYHSQASQHASALGPPTDGTIKVHSAFLNVLGDAGYPASYVTSNQVLAGRLKKGDIRALCLLHAFALSDEEIKEIVAFADGGGVVIADIPPAWMRSDCSLRPMYAMDGFFGIKQASLPDSPMKLEGLALSLSEITSATGAGMTYRLRGVNKKIQAGEGEVRYQCGEAPVAVVRRHGQGRSILMNAMPWDDPDTGKDSVAILKILLSESGIEPPFHYTLKEDIRTPGMKSYVFRHGDILIDAVLPPEESPAEIPVIVQMKWKDKAHTYDLRERKYLGELSDLEMIIPRSSPLVLARLPYVISEVKVNAPASSRAGISIEVSGTALHAKGETLKGHLFQMQVFGPDGAERPYYGGLLGTLREGDALSIPFAESDPPGDWEIVLTDVISGTAGKTRVSLQGR